MAILRALALWRKFSEKRPIQGKNGDFTAA
jgi:hypothetical protein